MEMDLRVFIIYIGVITMFFVFGKIFLLHLKVAGKLAANSILGGILLIIINFIGSGVGVFIPVNILNACVVGVLGLPGTIMLMILTT